MIAASMIVAAMACGSPGSVGQEAKQPCCFTNQRYTGVCREVPQGDETCGTILDYLNNANAVGKSYCGSTSVRGGWQQVACDDDGSQATFGPGTDASDDAG